MNDQKTNRLHPAIYLVMLVSLLYWSYLTLTSYVLIQHDSLGYRNTANILLNGPWNSYFVTGPNREPLYPLLISFSMRISKWTGIDYLALQMAFQVLILSLTQFLTAKALKKINASTAFSVLITAYFGFSPAIANSGGILYSEILTYPFILWLVLRGAQAWKDIRTASTRRLIINALYLAFAGILITFTKGIFEIIVPLLILPYIVLFWKGDRKVRRNVCVFLAVFMLAFQIPVVAYKFLNKTYNGVFTLTNRGSFALYGSTARRMLPLDAQRFKTALVYTSGADVCQHFFKGDCNAWGYLPSDTMASEKAKTLREQGLSAQQIDNALVRESLNKILSNPLQYSLLGVLEGMKLFFWEASEIFCIVYPEWVTALYDQPLFRFPLRFLIAIASLVVFIFGVLKIIQDRRIIFENPDSSSSLRLYIMLTAGFYILLSSPFLMAARYALPIAPLFLIMIAIFLNDLTKRA